MASKKHQDPPDETVTEAAVPPTCVRVRLVQVTIPAGQSLSDEAHIDVDNVKFLIMPESWSPANLSFQAAFDGEFFDLFGLNGAEVVLGSVSPKTVVDVSDRPLCVEKLKIRSGTRNAPKNQAEARTFTLVIVP